MPDVTLKLPLEVWERMIEILDQSGHPDSSYILPLIHRQLYFNPSDKPAEFVPDEKNPSKLKRT